jgi:hypothetical protein
MSSYVTNFEFDASKVLNQTKLNFEQAKSGNFLPDHRLTDAPGFAFTAPAVSPLSARSGFFMSPVSGL